MSLEKVSKLSPDMAVTPGCWLVVDVPVPISSKQVLVMGTGNTSDLKVITIRTQSVRTYLTWCVVQELWCDLRLFRYLYSHVSSGCLVFLSPVLCALGGVT